MAIYMMHLETSSKEGNYYINGTFTISKIKYIYPVPFHIHMYYV